MVPVEPRNRAKHPPDLRANLLQIGLQPLGVTGESRHLMAAAANGGGSGHEAGSQHGSWRVKLWQQGK